MAPKPVAYTDISTRLRPVEFPRVVRQLFRSRSEFADYLRRAMPGNAPRIPPIDWQRRDAILIAAGPRSSTGYVLHVVGVRETAGHVVVSVREQTPSLGEPVQARVTYPFRLITIPRIPKPLFLHWEGRP
jgi:PrcB C-terminal